MPVQCTGMYSHAYMSAACQYMCFCLLVSWHPSVSVLFSFPYLSTFLCQLCVTVSGCVLLSVMNLCVCVLRACACVSLSVHVCAYLRLSVSVCLSVQSSLRPCVYICVCLFLFAYITFHNPCCLLWLVENMSKKAERVRREKEEEKAEYRNISLRVKTTYR